MNRLIKVLTIGFLIQLPHFSVAYELGAWYKRPPEIPHALNTRFQPSFLILKTAIFSQNGSLKLVGEQKELKKLCDQNYKVIAWVTHRLRDKNKLTSFGGERLGQLLLKNFGQSCIKTIELDVEPITGEEIWLSEFLAKLKETVSGVFEIRMAIPLLSEEKTTGPFWKKENAQRLLSLVDGIDLMLYDSGIKLKEEYASLLEYNLNQAKELLKITPTKSILVGIPAYHDRTALHRDNIENITSFLSVLKNRSLADNSKICTGQIRIALYAGWTLSPEDRNSVQLLKAWLDETCKKDK